MHVVIDSTELKKDRGLNKEHLSYLKVLGGEEFIKIHIPYFVYKECSSSSIDELKTELNRIEKTLRSFDRKGMGKTDFSKTDDIIEKVEELLSNVENSNDQLWNDYVNDSNANLYDYDAKESISVFEAYFKGDKPFKSLKNRNDIPDAFIYQTVKKIAKTNKTYLVSNDKNLREKCGELKNLKIFDSFENLFDSYEFKAIDEKFTAQQNKFRIDEAKQSLLDHYDCFQDAVSDFIRHIDYLEITDTDLPSDNGDATVKAIDDVTTEILEDRIKFIDNKFFVPIEVTGVASLDYAVFKADYWGLEHTMPISEDLNKHYFLIEDVLPIKLSKTISIDIDKIKEDEPLNLVIEEFDNITIEVE